MNTYITEKKKTFAGPKIKAVSWSDAEKQAKKLSEEREVVVVGQLDESK